MGFADVAVRNDSNGARGLVRNARRGRIAAIFAIVGGLFSRANATVLGGFSSQIEENLS
jgi:hypothetical protein